METCRLPEEKLRCIEEAVCGLISGCNQFLPCKRLVEELPAADQLDPRFFYAVVMAAPRTMHSDLKYGLWNSAG